MVLPSPAGATKLAITRTGFAHGAHRIENQFFETLNLDTSAAWIEERTGIKARTSVLAPETIQQLASGHLSLAELYTQGRHASLADLAETAWRQSFSHHSNLGPKPKEGSPHLDEGNNEGNSKDNLPPVPDAMPADYLDKVISGTSVPDHCIPASASQVAQKLGLTAGCFDVNSACSSFITGLHTARGLAQLNQDTRIGLFQAERYSLTLDYKDRRSCILFGDGAAYTELEIGPSRKDLQESTQPGDIGHCALEVVDTLVSSDPSGAGLVVIPHLGHFDQNGAAVQKFAITRTVETVRRLLERNPQTKERRLYFIGHQANLRMLDSARQKLGLAPEQHLFNVDEFGNQGGAGASIVLAQHRHLFQPGDIIAIAVVGSGLTWGGALLEAF